MGWKRHDVEKFWGVINVESCAASSSCIALTRLMILTSFLKVSENQFCLDALIS
jgi:hypothetical protein